MSLADPIYLDAFASTPIAPQALEALTAQLVRTGNPHSPHAAGAQAAAAVEGARAAVAALIGADSQEIIFTSGATEANNIAVLGLARAAVLSGSKRRTIITSAIEHPSVLEAAAALVREGFCHRLAPVGADGRLALNSLDAILDDDTLLLAVMAANNVTGVIQPIKEAAAAARRVGAFVHVDGAQAVGKIPIDVYDWDLDSLSVSAHKLYGPPGIGALFISAALPVRPATLVHGGGQEHGFRSGTVPAGLVSALGAAASAAAASMNADTQRLRSLAALFRAQLGERQVRFQINGNAEHTLPGAMNISISGLDADDLVERLSSYVAISTGSACSNGQIGPAPSLREMRLSDENIRSALRIYFHRYSTERDAAEAARMIATVSQRAGVATGDFVQ